MNLCDPRRSVLALTAALALLIQPLVHASENANRTTAIERVGGDIQYLASDELEGRGPGTKGLQIAAEFIRDEFKQAGLTSGTADGSYMQPFEIDMDTKAVKEKCRVTLNGPDGKEHVLELGKEFQPIAYGGNGKRKAEIVFAGYGIAAPKMKYDDYEGADVEGKILLIIRREPQQDDAKSAFDGKKVTTHSYIRTKLQAAKKAKAAAVLFVNDPLTTTRNKKDELVAVSGFGTGGMGVPFAQLKQSTVNALLASSPLTTADGTKLDNVAAIESHIDKAFAPMTQPLEGWSADIELTFEKIKSTVANVVGVIEGEGPLADETIVIGAHYDHLGFGPFGSRRPNPRKLHPGADDNATGTAAIIELARRIGGRTERPPRRLVFVGFSAEERGLIGSNYYVKHPLYPLEKTVAMFNFDMIGQMKEDRLIVNGVPSAQELDALVDTANAERELEIRKGNVAASGDHYGFYQKGIPAVHFFTGITKQYHTPDDTFETINVEGVVRTIDYVERLLDSVAAMPQRLKFVKAKTTRSARGGMAYLGVTPDYAGGGDGLKIDEVANESPAKKAGLLAGDVIVQFGDIPVADIQGLADGLRSNKAGDKVQVIVKRGDKKVTVTVTLGRPKDM